MAIGINVTNPVVTNEPIVAGGSGWVAHAGASIYPVIHVSTIIEAGESCEPE